jgi:hypothetical protein
MGRHPHRRDLLQGYGAWLSRLGAGHASGRRRTGVGVVGRRRQRRPGRVECRLGAAAAATANSDSPAVDTATSYFVDTLFRPSDPARVAAPGTAESDQAALLASRILLASAATNEVSAEDRTYLVQLVAARTGLSEADAQARVDAVLTRIGEAKATAQQAADTARKASATFALVGALSLAIGAFIASAARALGGWQRDDDEVHYLSR